MCATGAADATGKTTYFCVQAPTTGNTGNAWTTGYATADNQCQITTYKADGTTANSQSNPICGYNANANFYCGYQLGDAFATNLLSLSKAFYTAANTQCNPAAVQCNAIKIKSIANFQQVGQLAAMFGYISAGVTNIGAYIVNNPTCV